MKPIAIKSILLFVQLIATTQVKLQLILSRDDSSSSSAPARFIAENSATNTDKNSFKSEQYPSPLRRAESNNGPAETYERVVLEGSSIRISCPHLIKNTLKTNSLSTVQKESDASVKHEPPASFGQQREQLGTNLEQVKWFRNHVPLLNLNHSQPSNGFLTSDAASPTTINITELHRTAESNPSVSKTWPQVAQFQAAAGTAATATTTEKNLLPGKVRLAQLSDSLRATNANEPPPDIRQRSNVLKPSHEQLAGSADWEINTFGELVISKVSKYFAGKYTCLVAGKQSEVLLDVLLDNRPYTRRNEQAIAIAESTVLGAPNVADVLDAAAGQSLANISFDSHHHELDGGLFTAINDSLKFGKEDFSPKTQFGRVVADTEIDAKRDNLAFSPVAADVRSLGAGPIEDRIAIELSQPSGTSKARNTEATRKRLSRWRPALWRVRPLHITRPEILEVDDLKLIPGLLYVKQQMHCPVDSSLGTHSAHIYTLVKELCGGSSQTKRDDIECRQLASRALTRILSEVHRKLGGCISSILDLLWFKDEIQLTFDSNGRSRNSTLNVKLINSNDQIAREVPERKSDSIEEDIRRNSSRTNRSGDCPHLLEGRTLEIEGLRKDNDGLYSCGLKLSILKLLRIIQSIRGPKGPSERGNNNEISGCDISHFSHEAHFKHEKSSLDSGTRIEPTATIPSEFNVRELLGQKAKLDVTNADGHLLTDRIALFRSFLEGEELVREQSLDCIERLLSRLRDPLTTVQAFSLVVSERPGQPSNVYIFHPTSNLPLVDAKAATTTSFGPPAALNSWTRLPPSADGEPEEAPIKRSNANIDDATELNRPQLLDERRFAYRQRQSRQNGHPDASAASHNPYPSSFGGNLDHTGTSNEVHLMHDNNDSRTSSSSYSSTSTVGVKQPGNHLPPSNADEFESLNIEVSYEQTKSHDPYEKPFNYANELNYGPLNAARAANSDVKTETLPLPSPPPTTPSSPSYLTERLIGQRADDYSSSGTKELITQRRRGRSHRINIEESSDSHRQAPKRLRQRRTTPHERSKLKRPPPTPLLLIDKQRQDDKTTHSFNDEASPLEVSNPLRTSAHQPEADSLRNSANGASGERFISDTKSRLSDRKARLSKRQTAAVAGEDDQQLETAEKLSVEQNSQLLIDGVGQGTSISSSSSSSGGSRHARVYRGLAAYEQGVEGGQSGAPSAVTRAIDGVEEQRLNLELFDPQPKVSGINDTPYHSQSALRALNEDDDTSDESLMWSASHYLYMHMKALATSSMFGVEVGVEWSNERTNQSDTPLDVESQAELYRDDASSRLKPLSASPFATIDMLSGQDLQLECTAHTLGRLPEVKWYKRVPSIPRWLKKSTSARRIGDDLYWPLDEIDLLGDKPMGHTSFIASQTITIFDNLVNQTFTVINNLQLSQYNDRTQLQNIRSNTSPMDDCNIYACIVDADVRHNYATLGVHFREALKKFSLDVTKRLRARTIMPGATDGDHWPTSVSQPDASVYDLFRTNQIHFPLGSHWIPIQNRTDLEDISYESLPNAPVMLTATIVVVSASLLTLVYLTVRSFRSLIELQMGDNLTEHKMVMNTDRHKYIASPDERFNTKYLSFRSDNQNDVVQAECSCRFGTELINENSPIGLNMQSINLEEDVIYELESTLTNSHSFGVQQYEPQYNDASHLVYQILAESTITDNPHRQDSYFPADEHLVDTTDNRLNINMFENPMSLDENQHLDAELDNTL